MENLEVDNVLLMTDSIFEKPVLVSFAKIANLNISNSRFSSLNLSGTQVNGTLILGTDVLKPPKWDDGAEVILNNAKVAVLIDREDSWPDKLELNGFTYSSYGEIRDGVYLMNTRSIGWLKKWLEKQKSYSPQPYEQLAKVLREQGYPSEARNIGYLSGNRETAASKGLNLRYIWLNLLKLTIGYGYKLNYIFWCVLGITFLGWLVLMRSNQGPGRYVKRGELPESGTKRILKGVFRIFKKIVVNFFFSLDMLLPVKIKFDEWSKVELIGKTKVYFYIHKRIGYILSFIIIAWLTGIIYRYK